MDRAPLVSIVIPAYNHARYLDEAIRSVLQQDYPQVELLVLDDGSTDGTRAVLEKYGTSFRWETQPNMGQAATLNKGWGLARGELLGYLSADDALLPDAIRASVACLEEHPEVVLTYPDYNLIDPASHVIHATRAPEYSYYDMAVDIVCAPGPGAVFRRKAFEAAGRWDASLRQIPDYECWLRLGLQGPFQRIPRVLAAFRVHEESQSFAGSDDRKAEEPRRALAAYFARADLPGPVAQAKGRALGQAHLLTARLHWRAGRYATALLRIAQAIALSPGLLLRKRTLVLLWETMVDRLRHRLAWRRNRLRFEK